MGIVLAILIFGFIIFFHELGHFALARINGINVDEFWIGMGPTLVHKKIGNTDYCLKLLPIGGACMMGEDEEDDQREGSFNSKSPLRRITVIAAGPVFNFILAFLCSLVFVSWVGYDCTVLSAVTENSAAEDAGLQAGDRITAVQGDSVRLFREIQMYNQFHPGERTEFTIERDGETFTVSLEPRQAEDGGWYYGFQSSGYTRGNILQTLGYSVYEVKYWIEMTVESLGQLITGQIGVDQLSGPVGVVDTVNTTYEASRSGGAALIIINLLRLTILLSANLGVMNLLPIPALDGARLVFLLVELVRGKRVPPEKEGYVHLAGMVLLLGLMVFVMYNDIRRVFF